MIRMLVAMCVRACVCGVQLSLVVETCCMWANFCGLPCMACRIHYFRDLKASKHIEGLAIKYEIQTTQEYIPKEPNN